MPSPGQAAVGLAGQLDSIGFVPFVISIVDGVFDVLTKSSLDQLTAYGEYVDTVSKTVAAYQTEVAGGAKNSSQVADYIETVLGLSTATDDLVTIGEDPNEEDAVVIADEPEKEALIAHFDGILVGGDNFETKVFEVVVGVPPLLVVLGDLNEFVFLKLKVSADSTHRLLTTILKLGMQKLVVGESEIFAKLTFSVEATDTSSIASTNIESKASSWNVGGRLSFVKKAFGLNIGGGYAQHKLMVSVVNERSSRAVNVNVDIIGSVRISFRTETFPVPAV